MWQEPAVTGQETMDHEQRSVQVITQQSAKNLHDLWTVPSARVVGRHLLLLDACRATDGVRASVLALRDEATGPGRQPGAPPGGRLRDRPPADRLAVTGFRAGA
jgi:hypothetical protein